MSESEPLIARLTSAGRSDCEAVTEQCQCKFIHLSIERIMQLLSRLVWRNKHDVSILSFTQKLVFHRTHSLRRRYRKKDQSPLSQTVQVQDVFLLEEVSGTCTGHKDNLPKKNRDVFFEISRRFFLANQSSKQALKQKILTEDRLCVCHHSNERRKSAVCRPSRNTLLGRLFERSNPFLSVALLKLSTPIVFRTGNVSIFRAWEIFPLLIRHEVDFRREYFRFNNAQQLFAQQTWTLRSSV